MDRKARTALCGLGVAALLGAAGAGSASAASSIVGADFGAPKAGIATTLNVRAIAEQSSSYIQMKTRASGGPPCAPTADTDPGSYLFSSFSILVGDTTTPKVLTFEKPGTFDWCGWMVKGSQVIAASSGSFTVASPVGAITGVSVPNPAPHNRNFVATISGTSEVSRYLLWRLRPAGEGPCGASPSLDAGSTSIQYASGAVLGNFSRQLALDLSAYGNYRLCSWIAKDTDDLNPLGVNDTPISSPAPRRTVVRVSASPGVARRSRAFNVNAFVASNVGAPTGRCAFDRRVRGSWKPYTSVGFTAGQACRVKIYAGELGYTVFRVRYIPANGTFARSTGFSRKVYVRR